MRLFAKPKKQPELIPLWDSADIPAKTYFKIIETDNLLLLGGNSDEERENAWSKIVDEDFEITQNTKVKTYLDKRCKIEALNLHIQAIKDNMYVIVYLPITEAIKEEVIRNLLDLGCKWENEKGIIDNCHRIAKSNIAILSNQVKILQDTVKQKSESIKSTFESDLVAIENVLMRPISEDVSLRYFREATKSAKAKSEANQKITQKNGKR